MIASLIENTLFEYKDKADHIKIGHIKEVLQTFVLDAIYSHPTYKNLLFYGGTATRFLFGLNRLSEDLDFIGRDDYPFEDIAKYLENFFQKMELPVTYKLQKFRITLIFKNFLEIHKLNYGKSKDLHIKVEISNHFDFCKGFKEEIYPVFKLGKSILIQSLSAETLFATKLNAVLYRKREKKIGNTTITVKGRDIYDLFRYLSNGYKPNISCIQGIDSTEQLQKELTHIIENTDFNSVIADIENFIDDRSLLEFFEKKGKNYLLENISNKL